MRAYQKTSLLGSAVLAMAVLANIFVFHHAIQIMADTEQWVNHTNAVRAETYAVESGIKDAQRGARGFIISHQQQSLNPYNLGQLQNISISSAPSPPITRANRVASSV